MFSILPTLLLLPLQEAQQQLQEEKQQHQRLTGSLLEHAGRLSHKYYNLSDDYGQLQKRCGCAALLLLQLLCNAPRWKSLAFCAYALFLQTRLLHTPNSATDCSTVKPASSCHALFGAAHIDKCLNGLCWLCCRFRRYHHLASTNEQLAAQLKGAHDVLHMHLPAPSDVLMSCCFHRLLCCVGCRYHHLASTNEQLAAQLKEAHEALYDLQAAVQATPPAKRQQQCQLIQRMSGAEQVRRRKGLSGKVLSLDGS
jgi:hypothetical protein